MGKTVPQKRRKFNEVKVGKKDGRKCGRNEKGWTERVRRKEKERESRPEEKTPFSDSTPDQIKIGLHTLYYLREEKTN